MTLDYDAIITIERAAFAGVLFYALCRKGVRAAGWFLFFVGLFFVAYGLSLGVFFARPYMPPEYADLLRNVGQTIQAIGLTAAGLLWLSGKVD